MSIICPKCNSDDTTLFSDTLTKENGLTCLNCKKDFGIIDQTNVNKLLNELNKLEISYQINENKYVYIFTKDNKNVNLKIDTIIDSIHNDYDIIDFSSTFEHFFDFILTNFFILDLEEKNIKSDYINISLTLNKEKIEITSDPNKYYEKELIELLNVLLNKNDED